jgi:hypothetical protein
MNMVRSGLVSKGGASDSTGRTTTPSSAWNVPVNVIVRELQHIDLKGFKSMMAHNAWRFVQKSAQSAAGVCVLLHKHQAGLKPPWLG